MQFNCVKIFRVSLIEHVLQNFFFFTWRCDGIVVGKEVAGNLVNVVWVGDALQWIAVDCVKHSLSSRQSGLAEQGDPKVGNWKLSVLSCDVPSFVS